MDSGKARIKRWKDYRKVEAKKPGIIQALLRNLSRRLSDKKGKARDLNRVNRTLVGL